MLIGCCVNMLPVTPLAGAEYIPALAAMGYDYVELPMSRLGSLSGPDFEKAAELLRKSGIPCRSCNNFMPGEYKITGPEDYLTPRSVLMDHIENTFRRIGKEGLQVPVAVFGSPWSRSCPEGFSMEKALLQIEDFLRSAAQYAERYGITIAIENNNSTETNTLNRYSDVVDMVKRIGHPSVRALCDYFHVRVMEEDPGAVLKNSDDLLVHTHIAKLSDRGWFTDLSGEEQYIRRYAEALKALNYNGGISMEAPAAPEHWEDLAKKTLPVLKGVFS
jgi:sugar phosphate isomerase/epimerase